MKCLYDWQFNDDLHFSSYHPHQSSPPHAGDPPVTSRPPSQGWMTSSPAASETDSNDTGVSSSPSGGGGGPFKRCEALYDYTEGLEANNIPMFGGDQFYVIEEDSEGWTRSGQYLNFFVCFL